MTGNRRTPEGRDTADEEGRFPRGVPEADDEGGPSPGSRPRAGASGTAAAGPTAGSAAGAGPGAGAGAGAGRTPAGDDLESALATALHERDEYLDMVRRVQADFENYKKRMVRQQTDLLERAAEALVVRLLPVLDAFDLARNHLEAEGSPEGKALLQAAGLLSDTLAKEGLERLGTEGVTFDPSTHEAVEHQPAAEGEADDGDAGPVVTDVLRPGYRYKGRVVRPAMVRVRG